MNCRTASALIFTIATTLLIGRAAKAQQSFTPQQADLAIEKIAAEANARIAAGVPDADVEAWMSQAVTQAGMTVKKKPENWDVYGQASWGQEVSQDEEKQPEYREPGELGNMGGLPTREPVDGRQQTHSETEGHGNDPLYPEASNEGLGHRVRGRSGGHAQEQSSPPVVDYVFKGGLGATGSTQLEDGVYDARVTEKGEATLPRSGSID